MPKIQRKLIDRNQSSWLNQRNDELLRLALELEQRRYFHEASLVDDAANALAHLTWRSTDGKNFFKTIRIAHD